VAQHTRLLFAALCLLTLALAACGGRPAPSSAQARPEMAVPVSIGRVVRKPEPIEVRAIGNVQQFSTVQVKSQVAGQLVGVYFKEGDFVRKGQLLFRIDPRTFEAALNQARANRAKDAAQAATAAVEAERYTSLFSKGVVSREQADQIRTNAEALKATLAADDAQIQTAEVQLGYTTIRSPLDGRTGNLLVQAGNLIKENDVPLVVINQVEPIYVSFAVPAQSLGEITDAMRGRALRVVAVPNDGKPPQTGTLAFINNTVDMTTGTIQLKATFPNRNRVLWPGEFANVALTLATRPAVVAPSAAVQTSQKGQYVFVVRPDMHVEERPITVARTVGADTVIEQGLAPGETVVTDGQLRLVNGAKISVAPAVGQGATGA
jgi:multidrug efflux system membrane fusion protein